MAAHNELGKWGEQIAADFLESKGWYIRHRDWTYKHKDLDIVCIDGDMTTLLFVEVKTRSSDMWGAPDEAITLEKSKNIIDASAAYIKLFRLEHLEIRYDTISIIGTPDTSHTIEHKENVISLLDKFQYYERKRKSSRYKKNNGTWGSMRWGRGY